MPASARRRSPRRSPRGSEPRSSPRNPTRAPTSTPPSLRGTSIPHVVLTSNGPRELSDALRRRCLYHYVDYPSEDKELRIVLARVPGIATALAAQIVRFVQALRREDLRKKPGIAETLDWAAALVGLGVKDLRDDPEALYATLLCLLKTNQDRQAMPADMAERLAAKLG